MSWEKRGENSYRLIAFLGYDNSGKKLMKRKTIKISEKMSEKQLDKFLSKEAALFQQEVEKGLFLDADKVSFEEFSQRWMAEYAEKHLSPKTVKGYKEYLRRINQGIGHIKLGKLQPNHLSQLYSNLAEGGVRWDEKYVLCPKYAGLIDSQRRAVADGAGVHLDTINNLLKGNSTTRIIAERLSQYFNAALNKVFIPAKNKQTLSSKTIAHHHRVISSILSKAVKWQVLLTNPASRVEPPKVKRVEAAHYDEEQVLEMFRLLADEPLKYQVAVYIALYGGLRLGEVAALDWVDIDFEERTLSITKSRQYVPGIGVIEKEPKTERGIRKIGLSDGVLEILMRYKDEQSEESKKLHNKWADSGKILVQWNGVPMHPQSPSKWFGKWLARNNLPKITFHQLRHSHASILIANGVDIATVSKRLGHAKVSTTIDTYTHALKNRDEVAANLLDDILTSRK